jgi:hypothetical protein
MHRKVPSARAAIPAPSLSFQVVEPRVEGCLTGEQSYIGCNAWTYHHSDIIAVHLSSDRCCTVAAHVTCRSALPSPPTGEAVALGRRCRSR